MKNSKLRRVLMLAACAVLLVCLSVGATLAYLTSTTEVVQNTFTVGKVEIILDETDVDLYGEKDGEDRVLENDYKLLPGHTYIKDPTVTVKAGSEDSYIRMIVSISHIDELKAIFGEDFLPQYFVAGWDSDTWLTTGSIVSVGNTNLYEFRYFETVNTLDGNDLVLDDLFETITVPGDVTNDELATLEGMEINVIAYAIQADGFADADEAWAAFEE